MDTNRFHIPGRRSLPPPRGSTPPPSPKREAPTDPAKRRRFFQGSDEVEGEMTIENFLYQIDSYRSTTSLKKFPRPMCKAPIRGSLQKTIQTSVGLYEALLIALKDQKIKATNVQFFNLSKPGYAEGGEIRVPTLVVEVKTKDNDSTQHWSAAKKDLQSVLEKHELDNIDIEIVDPDKTFQPSLSAIAPDHPSIEIYESFRQELLEIIRKELTEVWISICLWHVDGVSSDCKINIVILVKPGSLGDWKELSKDVQTIIQKANGDPDKIGILFMPGACGDLETLDTEDGGRSLAKNLPQNPHLGSSIGVEGELGGGTFGGYFDLRRISGQSPTGKYVLTNAHVVRPAQSTTVDTRRDYDLHGVGLDDPALDPRQSIVRYPALKDLNCTRSDLRRRLQKATGSSEGGGEIDQLQEALGRARIDDKASRISHLEKRLNEETNRAEHYRQLLARCESMPTNIGQIFFSTGRGLNEKQRILDFALVEVQDQDMKNYARTHGNSHLGHGIGEVDSSKGFRNLDVHGDLLEKFEKDVFQGPVAQIGAIRKGCWYFKSGRTTDFTGGICNGTEAFVNLAGYRTSYDMDGNPAPFKHYQYSEELVIATPTWKQIQDKASLLGVTGDIEPDAWLPHIQKDFVKLGDSGALIVDEDNNACGLVFGHITGAVGRYEWAEIAEPMWKEPKDIRLGVEQDNLGLQPYKDVQDPYKCYGACCGLIMSFADIQEHLRLRIGMELDLP